MPEYQMPAPEIRTRGAVVSISFAFRLSGLHPAKHLYDDRGSVAPYSRVRLGQASVHKTGSRNATRMYLEA